MLILVLEGELRKNILFYTKYSISSLEKKIAQEFFFFFLFVDQ